MLAERAELGELLADASLPALVELLEVSSWLLSMHFMLGGTTCCRTPDAWSGITGVATG